MTDSEEAFYKAVVTPPAGVKGFRSTVDAWKAWQARGELDAVRIKEPMIIKQENGMVLKLGYDELPNGTAFYTTPSREWQSLSDEEIGRLAVFDGLHHVEIPLLAKFIIAIDKALREKNNA